MSTHTIPEIFALKACSHSSCSFWSGEFSVIFQHWPQSLPSFNLSLIWFNIRVIMKKSRKMWNYLVIYHLQKKPQRYSYTFVVSTSLFIIHTCNSQYYRHFPQSANANARPNACKVKMLVHCHAWNIGRLKYYAHIYISNYAFFCTYCTCAPLLHLHY